MIKFTNFSVLEDGYCHGFYYGVAVLYTSFFLVFGFYTDTISMWVNQSKILIWSKVLNNFFLTLFQLEATYACFINWCWMGYNVIYLFSKFNSSIFKINFFITFNILHYFRYTVGWLYSHNIKFIFKFSHQILNY